MLTLIENLTGQAAPLGRKNAERALRYLKAHPRIGFSQFNELLLLLGYDRVSQSFFQFLVNGTTKYEPGTGIRSIGGLRAGVERVQRFGLLYFGNIKFAFKTFATDPDLLGRFVAALAPQSVREYQRRHAPIQPIESIAANDTFYLGYVVEQQLKSRVRANAADNLARRELTKLERIREVARRNFDAYLASDHLDVYVATSMRQPHECLSVHELTRSIFRRRELASLNVRWFDPTQAYCSSRLDKGLAEALMLKRAKCTLYLVQESDTLGKDSELASTLAQGKPVIAFVPSVDEPYVERLLRTLKSVYKGRSERELILDQLMIFEPESAWKDAELIRWIHDPRTFRLEAGRKRLLKVAIAHYDSRAKTLREVHPLGIQVNLDNGVANGVLVVRTAEDTAELVRRVLTRTLRFTVQVSRKDRQTDLVLLERISGCVFRVMTGNAMLTNAFWNFYLRSPELGV